MDDEQHKTEGRGRSARKREVHAIAKLAERLVELPRAALSSLPLEDDLRAELMELRRTKGRASRKRSLKHFAGQLRGDDEVREKLLAALSQRDRQQGLETAHHKELEQLRERLCSAEGQDAALKAVAADYPAVDLKALKRLISAVRRGHDKGAYREIFRRLRQGKQGT